MKTIKLDLPRELSELEIHTFADEHFGDEHCDVKRLLARIEADMVKRENLSRPVWTRRSYI